MQRPPLPLALALLCCACLTQEMPHDTATISAMPCDGTWHPAPRPPLSPRLLASTTATPSGVVVFGGMNHRGPVSGGAIWNGARWRALPDDGAPAPRYGHAAVWLDDALCIWGGTGFHGVLGDGACWSPVTDAWTPLPTEGAPSARGGVGACASDGALVVFGGVDDDDATAGDGAIWSSGTRRWQPLPDAGAPRARRHPLVTPWPPGSGDVLVWGGAGDALALGAEDAAVYEARARRWRPLGLDNAPSAGEGVIAAPTPRGILAWSPRGATLLGVADERWEHLGAEAPVPRYNAGVTTLLRGVAAWGGRGDDGVVGEGVYFDADMRRWCTLPTGGAPPAREGATVFHDGRSLWVLWGRADGEWLDDAWRLSP